MQVTDVWDMGGAGGEPTMTSAIFLCAAQPSPGGDLRLSEPDSHREWQDGRFCRCGQFSQSGKIGMVLKWIGLLDIYAQR